MSTDSITPFYSEQVATDSSWADSGPKAEENTHSESLAHNILKDSLFGIFSMIATLALLCVSLYFIVKYLA